VGSPFHGPRHRSWLSDTVIFAAVFVIVLLATVITDILNGPADPPAYLVGLCGAAGSALFGAVSSDKSKREREIIVDAAVAKDRSLRTEQRVDALVEFAANEHPEDAHRIPPKAAGDTTDRKEGTP